MPEVKWIRIAVDMFDNRKLKHIRSLPGGNDMALIWVMLLAMAGRCNADGAIYLTEGVPYTAKMLSTELGFKEKTVSAALDTFCTLHMLERAEDGSMLLPSWSKHQNIDGLEKIREQNRDRKRAQRQRERNACEFIDRYKNASVTQGVTACHTMSRDSHATDIDIEEDIEEVMDSNYLNKEKEENNYSVKLSGELADKNPGNVEKPVGNASEPPEDRQTVWENRIVKALLEGRRADANRYYEWASRLDHVEIDIEEMKRRAAMKGVGA